MSHFYIATPTEAACWSQPVDEVERQVRIRWPEARIRSREEGPYALEWDVQMTHGLLVGEVDRNGTTLVVRGDLHDCIEAAIWFRELVSEVQPLTFCVSSYRAHIDLRRGMSPEEVAAPFLAK